MRMHRRTRLPRRAVYPRRRFSNLPTARWGVSFSFSIGCNAAQSALRQSRCIFGRGFGSRSRHKTEYREHRGNPCCADMRCRTALIPLRVPGSTFRSGSTPWWRSSSRPFDFRPGYAPRTTWLIAHIRVSSATPRLPWTRQNFAILGFCRRVGNRRPLTPMCRRSDEGTDRWANTGMTDTLEADLPHLRSVSHRFDLHAEELPLCRIAGRSPWNRSQLTRDSGCASIFRDSQKLH